RRAPGAERRHRIGLRRLLPPLRRRRRGAAVRRGAGQGRIAARPGRRALPDRGRSGGVRRGAPVGGWLAGGPVSRLPRVMTLRDVVLFNVTAIVGLRWLTTAGRIGPASLLLWLLAMVIF